METGTVRLLRRLRNLPVWLVLWNLFDLQKCWESQQEWSSLLLVVLCHALHSFAPLAPRGSRKVPDWGKYNGRRRSIGLLFRLRQLPDCRRNQGTRWWSKISEKKNLMMHETISNETINASKMCAFRSLQVKIFLMSDIKTANFYFCYNQFLKLPCAHICCNT